MRSPFSIEGKLRRLRAFIEAPVGGMAPDDVTERGMRYYEHVRLPTTATPLFVTEIGSPGTEVEEERRYVFAGFPALLKGSRSVRLGRIRVFAFVPARMHGLMTDYFMQVREIYVSADGRYFSYVTRTGLALLESGPGVGVHTIGLTLVFKEDRIVHGWHESYF